MGDRTTRRAIEVSSTAWAVLDEAQRVLKLPKVRIASVALMEGLQGVLARGGRDFVDPPSGLAATWDDRKDVVHMTPTQQRRKAHRDSQRRRRRASSRGR